MSPPNTTTTTLRPTDLRELRDAVLDTPGTVSINGAGTAAGWAGALRPVDAVLDLTALTGVIIHNPGDMTVSVRAGTPLRELNDELAAHGQHVSLDAARIDDGATVGGLVATGDAGPSALVYGSPRDLVIGVTMVLADGTVARSGGHVIKNVAGYDLAKVLHGSFGTLGVLAEVVLRLHPRPRATATVALDCPLPEAAERGGQVLASPLEPVALEWVSGEPGSLLVRLEGTPDALPARVDRLRELLGPSARRHVGVVGARGRAVGRDGGADGAEDPWARHAELVRGGADRAVLRIGARPSRLPGLLADLPAGAAGTAGLGTGVATVTVPADAADAVAELHRRVHAAGGSSMLRARPAGFAAPAWGPPPSALGVLRAVKTTLDPGGRFGPGRFDTWE